MQKRILLVASIVGILVLFTAGAYYVAVYLPQKQKMSMDVVKLELEAKIEQEKTEQLKIEQKKIEDDTNKKAEALIVEQQEKDLKEKEAIENSRKNTTARNTCLANAKTAYQKMVNNIEDGYKPNFSGMSGPGIVNSLKKISEAKDNAYDQASEDYTDFKNDCYHKYPLPNENF